MELSPEEKKYLISLMTDEDFETDDSDNPFDMLPKMPPDIKFAILFYLVIKEPNVPLTWDYYYNMLDNNVLVLLQYAENIQTVPDNIRDNLALHAFNSDIDEFFKNISYSFYGSQDDINTFPVFDVNEDGGFIGIMLAAYTNVYNINCAFPDWAVELFDTSVSVLDEVHLIPISKCYLLYPENIGKGSFDKNISLLKNKLHNLSGRDQVAGVIFEERRIAIGAVNEEAKQEAEWYVGYAEFLRKWIRFSEQAKQAKQAKKKRKRYKKRKQKQAKGGLKKKRFEFRI